MTTPLLDLRGLSKSFEAGQRKVLENVDLTIEKGEFIAVVGRSGAGKSTLLNLLGLLDVPDGGSLRISGAETLGMTERDRDALRARKIGFVFQDSFVMSADTVARNVALPLRMNNAPPADQLRTVTASLEHFDLLAQADQVAGTLSGGERQRVAFARAIANAPDLLLADEPTGNLDSVNTSRVMQILQELSQQGVTIVLITHSEEVAESAERIIRIHDGKLEETSQPKLSSASPSRPGRPTVEPNSAPGYEGQEHQLRQNPVRWHFAEALTALLLSPVRSITILAAFLVAIGGLVLAANLTSTAAEQVSSALSAAALDEVNVRFDEAGDAVAASELIADIEGVTGATPVVELASADAAITRPIGAASLPFAADVRAVDPMYLRLNGIATSPGNASDLFGTVDGTPTLLLSPALAAEWGIPEGRTGDVVSIADQRAVVVGFITAAERDPTLDSVALLSRADFSEPEASTISVLVRTVPGFPASVADAIPLTVDPVHPENVRVQTVADLRDLSKGVNSDLASTVFVISAVLLALVCLTSSISMFLTVLSRTREIALRRAVGATRRDIRLLFLIEGTILGFAGGMAGASLGVAGTTIICVFLGWSPYFDPIGAGAAVLLGSAAGALSSVTPARRASMIEPAQALRSL